MVEELPRKPSSAAEVREKVKKDQSGQIVELPSGFSATIRRPALSRLLIEGRIPSDLTTAVTRIMGGTTPSTPQEYTETFKFMNLIFEESFVDPKFKAIGATEEEIGPEHLSDEDRRFLMMYIQSGVADLKSFRNETGVEDIGSTGQEVPGAKA